MSIVKFLIIFSIINNNLISAENHYRIIGGNPAPIEKHPWMVSIQFLNVHFCGGSIINENSIITAAHCFDETPFALTIEAGTADLTQSGVSMNVDQILVHENYNPETYDFDIAILKLTENLNFNEKIQPILLPDESIEISDETPVVTSGWGVTEEDGIATSNILLEVEIYTRNWEECKETLKNDNQITERMLCAGYSKGGRDTCQADSGGALEMNGSLIGIVSWGHGCGEAEYPGVYTKVQYFVSWIKEHIE